MNHPSEWRPSAPLDRLRLRARLLGAVRRFFDERGYFEVDTPLASRERVIDPHLEPFAIVAEAELAAPASAGDSRSQSAISNPRFPASGLLLYLQTSPEFAMKRLLAAGAEAIYQIAHVFRAGELGRWHNPEFTMVEWYRAADDHRQQMQVVEELVVAVCGAALSAAVPATPFARTSYRDAFLRHAGADVAGMETAHIGEWARSRGLHPPPGLAADDRDGWLNWLLAELVEPHLGRERPEFVYDYPASQAALAVVRPEVPPVAERFELYWRGIELCNGYHELRDVQELRGRIEAESHRRVRQGLPPLPLPERFLETMRSGLPDCAGVALGFDRLMALAIGADGIGEVLPFQFDRA